MQERLRRASIASATAKGRVEDACKRRVRYRRERVGKVDGILDVDDSLDWVCWVWWRKREAVYRRRMPVCGKGISEGDRGNSDGDSTSGLTFPPPLMSSISSWNVISRSRLKSLASRR